LPFLPCHFCLAISVLPFLPCHFCFAIFFVPDLFLIFVVMLNQNGIFCLN
jgi:hypothetical protein